MNHLICHIWPGREHGTWRRTVQHLLARRDLFDGKRLVSIVSDKHTDELGMVIDAFGDWDVQFRFLDNDASKGEGVSFPSLLRCIQSQPGQTFYCHSKGASHEPGALSQQWADLMFHLCLDYPNLVAATLHDHPIAGSCRRIEQRMSVDWHYSGTFFWFRNDVTLGAPKTTDRNCVERWPAENFSSAVSGDLGMADCRNLYDAINWRSWITRRFQKEVLWDAQRKADRVRREGLPETQFEPLGVIYAE